MRSGWKGPLLSAATLALLAFLFAAAELWCRWRYPEPEGPSDASLRQFLSIAGPCYRSEYRADGSFLVKQPGVTYSIDSPRATQRSPWLVPRRRDARVRRIAVIGESSAYMLGGSLQLLLEHLPCSERYELLECSTPGGNLPLLERRFDEVKEYAPDAIFVVFGHNLYFSLPTSTWRLRLELLRRKSRLLSRLLRPSAPPPPPAQDPAVAIAALDGALRRFAREARVRGSSLIVSTMASNLWFAPLERDGAADDPRYLEARLQYALGERQRAIDLLRRAAAEGKASAAPLWHYQLAGWLYAAGDWAGARDHLLAALDGDPQRFRASRAVNDAIRTAGREAGFAVHDTEAETAARADHGIPGWGEFIDNCHLEGFGIEAGHLLRLLPPIDGCPLDGGIRFIAGFGEKRWSLPIDRQLAWLLRQAGSPESPHPGVWLRNLEGYAVQAVARLGPSAAEEIVRALDGKSLPTFPPRLRAEALVDVAEGLDRAGLRDAALAINQRVRDGGPSDDAWVQKGLFDLREQKRDEAARAFEKALAIRPDRADARFFLRRLAQLP